MVSYFLFSFLQWCYSCTSTSTYVIHMSYYAVIQLFFFFFVTIRCCILQGISRRCNQLKVKWHHLLLFQKINNWLICIAIPYTFTAATTTTTIWWQILFTVIPFRLSLPLNVNNFARNVFVSYHLRLSWICWHTRLCQVRYQHLPDETARF